MSAIIAWIRNNAVTIVEAVSLVYDALEIVINGLARLVPGNKTITVVHDVLAKVDAPLKQLKAWLVSPK